MITLNHFSVLFVMVTLNLTQFKPIFAKINVNPSEIDLEC